MVRVWDEGWSAYRMDEVRWVRSELITCWNKFQIRWKIIGQAVFNSTWRSWNTGWSVLSAKILEWWSWWSERVRCWQDGGWGMTWNYQEHRATEVESEMGEVQEFTERNLQEFGKEVVAKLVGFTIIRGVRLYRVRTVNTKRYIVFCIFLTSSLHTTGSGITFILVATIFLFWEQMRFLLLLGRGDREFLYWLVTCKGWEGSQDHLYLWLPRDRKR